ncbi:MAG TPA: hypothetical protein VNP93_13030 [Gaiellaceae bacterium]|nr:hypothetical protein [Gaiellaceae bacterium]
MPELWTPGMAGPVDELVARIHRRIKEFASEHGVEAMVEAELADGSLHRLRSISAEPGFGFVTLDPHTDTNPEVLIVPIGAIRQLTITASEPERRIGFSLPSQAAK